MITEGICWVIFLNNFTVTHKIVCQYRQKISKYVFSINAIPTAVGRTYLNFVFRNKLNVHLMIKNLLIHVDKYAKHFKPGNRY